jgi:hypothetical protein
MKEKTPREHGFSRPLVIFFLGVAAIVVALLFFGQLLRQFVRDSLMQHSASAHYEILYPARAISPAIMNPFAQRRESLFADLDKKIGEAGSGARIRIVFETDPPGLSAAEDGQAPYSVTGTTIRTKLKGQTPQLPPAADAEALLYAAWGKPGNRQIVRWTANWLVGEWRGTEIGMAAAGVEQRLGHKKVESLLSEPPGKTYSVQDQDLLGAAWISEIAEFAGRDAVRKLYTAKMAQPSMAEVTNVLGTPPPELERRWQMWMYAYLAGMPSMPGNSSMPMDMPMPGGH